MRGGYYPVPTNGDISGRMGSNGCRASRHRPVDAYPHMYGGTRHGRKIATWTESGLRHLGRTVLLRRSQPRAVAVLLSRRRNLALLVASLLYIGACSHAASVLRAAAEPAPARTRPTPRPRGSSLVDPRKLAVRARQTERQTVETQTTRRRRCSSADRTSRLGVDGAFR